MDISDYLLISTAAILIISVAFFSVMLAVPNVTLEASVQIAENGMAIILLPENIRGDRENIENTDWTWAIFRNDRKLVRGEGNSLIIENIPVIINCDIRIENGDVLKIWYRGLLIFKREISK
ncbi:MAG: hypothetical protein QXX33_03210 [Candidatus Hadarchaeales archaeon]